MKKIFDDNVALKVGVEASVFLCNLAYWMHKNKENNKNFVNGRFWSYNSFKNLAKVFPFWSEDKIKRIVRNLREKGVICTDNFNKHKYDKTLWYTIIDEKVYAQSLGGINSSDKSKSHQSIGQNAHPKVQKSSTNTRSKNNIKKHKRSLPLVRDFKEYNFDGPESFSNCLQDFDREKKLKGLCDEDFKVFSAKWKESKKESEIASSYFNNKPLTS